MAFVVTDHGLGFRLGAVWSPPLAAMFLCGLLVGAGEALADTVRGVIANDMPKCAVPTNGGAQCWANTTYGQLADETTTNQSTASPVSGSPELTAVAVAAGGGYTCAVTGGGVRCWGANFSGQLGDGTTTNRSTPTAVIGRESGMGSVTAADSHTCARTPGGGVECWGGNWSGQLGDGTTNNRSTPTPVVGLLSGVDVVAVGYSHTCALTTAGGVQCWGANFYGQVGDGTTTDRLTPTAVSGLGSGVVALYAGGYHTCAVMTSGAVRCWGRNSDGQLGDGTTTSRATPTLVAGLEWVAGLALGGAHTCAQTAGAAVLCWGYNLDGQVGDGTTNNRSVPTAVVGLGSGVAQVAAGGLHTCALTATQGLRCWGANGFGRLGDGTTTSRSVPTVVVGMESGVAAVTAGSAHTCAVMAAGRLKCWGSNSQGELGDGTTTSRSTPVTVGMPVAPDIGVTLSAVQRFGRTLLLPNRDHYYTELAVRVTNMSAVAFGGSLALGLQLPAGVQMGAGPAAPAGWQCVWPAIGMSGEVSCSTSSGLDAGASVDFLLAVRNVSCGATCGDTYAATVSGQVDDSNPANDRATASVTAFAPGPPTITAVSPSSGTALGGTTVTVTGTNLPEGSRVIFGSVQYGRDQMAALPNLFTVTTRRSPVGNVDVTVITPDGQTVTRAGAFTFVADGDGDGLDDAWEEQFGLDPTLGTGVNGAEGDPDGDGASNTAEQAAGTHPRGFVRRYFAEGATSALFDTHLALLNVAGTPARTLLRFVRATGAPVNHKLTVKPRSRSTVRVKEIAGLEQAEFGVVVESDQSLVVDRTMSWDSTGYGAHAETSLAAPATEWYLAEGTTLGGFQLFYLLQNANTTAATVTVEYLLDSGAPVTRQYTVSANSRRTIWVNEESGLPVGSLSAVIRSDLPILVERAMYRDGGGQMYTLGHESAALRAPNREWLLAEGATGPYFDLFVLIANPGTTPAAVQARFLKPDGSVVTRQYRVPAKARFTIWVDEEGPELANAAVSTAITADVPVLVERAMYWPGDPSTWHEAHNSAGTTQTGLRWAVAEGQVGGPRNHATYVLMANVSATPGRAQVTVLLEDGTSRVRVYDLAPNSRTNADIRSDFLDLPSGTRFGTLIEALPPAIGGPPPQLVVEWAVYSDANGVRWAAGVNALATRLDADILSGVREVAAGSEPEVVVDVLSQVHLSTGRPVRLVSVMAVPVGNSAVIEGGTIRYSVNAFTTGDHQIQALVEDLLGNQIAVPIRVTVTPIQACLTPGRTTVQAGGGFNPQGVAVDATCRWPAGTKELTVALSGGDAATRARVMFAAAEWTKYSGILFRFIDGTAGDIRVTFDRAKGSSSYYGPCQNSGPSMNLQADASTTDERVRRVTLHEFGHALGLIHEHQTPATPIEWNVPAVYEYYSGPPNKWSREDIDAYVLKRAESTNFSAYDPHSVMHYPIDSRLTLNGYSSEGRSTLSVTDKLFMRTLYQGSPAPQIAGGITGDPVGGFEVLKTAGAWQYYWSDKLGRQGVAPSIDFSESMVLVINLVDCFREKHSGLRDAA